MLLKRKGGLTGGNRSDFIVYSIQNTGDRIQESGVRRQWVADILTFRLSDVPTVGSKQWAVSSRQ